MGILKNKILIYLSTRYLTYGLQFLISLIIAAKLGPYYLGIYGVVVLIISYFTQINLGVPHSLNVLLVHNKNNIENQNCYAVNSLIIFSYLSLAVITWTFIWAYFGNLSYGNYKLDKYIILITLIVILTYFNSILTTIIRFRNQVNMLSLFGTIPVILNLIVVCLFKEDDLVMALTICNLLSLIICTALTFIKIPNLFSKDINFNVDFQKQIIGKGFYLFLYNSCFYFILIVVRTFVSRFYTIEEFGYFTFSYTLANSVMLLLDSLNTIIFPKTIDLLSSNNKNDILSTLEKLRIGYITTSHLLIYAALIFFPLFVMLFPKYKLALSSMNMISLAILMNSNSYGYNTLLIARNKEKISSRISLFALFTTIALCAVLVFVFHVNFSYVITSMLIAYFFFSLFAAYEGNKVLTGKSDWKYTVNQILTYKTFIPYIIAFFISILNLEYFIFIPLIIFLCLNKEDLKYIVGIVKKLINNPNVIDL